MNGHALISDTEIDAHLYEEIYIYDVTIYINLHERKEYLHNIEQLMRSPLTQCQVIMLKKHTASFLQTAAFKLNDMYTNRSGQSTNTCMLLTKCHVICQVWLCFRFVVSCHVLLQGKKIQRSHVCHRDNKGQVSTAGSDVQQTCRPREVC